MDGGGGGFGANPMNHGGGGTWSAPKAMSGGNAPPPFLGTLGKINLTFKRIEILYRGGLVITPETLTLKL